VTVYYVTIPLVAYFALLAQAMKRRSDGQIVTGPPTTSLYWAFAILSGLPLLLVNGLRWRVGTDYGAYALGFHRYAADFRAGFDLFSEPGIRAVAWLTTHIYDDYAAFIFITAALIVVLNVWTIAKWSDSLAMALLLYVLAGAWHGSFNGVRQHLAASVVLAGHQFIVERKFVAYLAAVTLAGLFHVSAFALILLYFVPRKGLSLRSLALILAAAVVALYSSDAIIGAIETATQDDYSGPGQSYVFNDVSWLRVAVAVAPVALYFLSAESAGPRDWFYRNLAVVHAIVMVAASGSTYLARFGIYTAAFLPLFIPQLVKFRDPGLTVLARVAVLALFAYYWFSAVAPSEALNNFQWVFDRLERAYR